MKIIKNNKWYKACEELSTNIFYSKNSITSFWIENLNSSPNFSLIQKNTFNQTIKQEKYLYLVSAVANNLRNLEKIESLNVGMGCMGNVMYCVQAFSVKNDNFRLHNFGTTVMKHKKGIAFTPLLFKIKNDELKIGEINYLRMGLLLNTIRKTDLILNLKLKKEFGIFLNNINTNTNKFINECIFKYNSKHLVSNVVESEYIINMLANLTPIFNSLSYIYFESVSLALMLNSEDKITEKLKSHGEFNNNLYIDIVHRFKENRSGKKFESYGFSPIAQELKNLIQEMQDDNLLKIKPDQILIDIANNIIMYIGTSFHSKESITGMAFFDFCMNSENNKICQPKLDSCVATVIRNYFNFKKFDLVINNTIEKGEIGIVPDISPNKFEIFLSEYNKNLTNIKSISKLNLKLLPIDNFLNI